MHYPTRWDLSLAGLPRILVSGGAATGEGGEIHDKGQGSGVCNGAIYPRRLRERDVLYPQGDGFNIIERF